MGYAISWLAVRDMAPQQILDELDLVETAETEEIPESDISAAQLPDAWYLLWFNQCESPYVQPEVMGDLPRQCSVVVCVIEEHVMYSCAELWHNGERIWQVSHDAQQGMYDLQTAGVLPDTFESTRADLFAQQEAEGGDKADVDFIFDLPLALAKQVTGFKHDELTPADEELEYTVLADNRSETGDTPWWKLW